jgi:predicted metal-binding membrane protein
MTPEARARRRIRTPVVAVTALAWVALLLLDLLAAPSGVGHDPNATTHGGPAPVGHLHHAAPDAEMVMAHGSDHSISLQGWALMLTAMMAPLLIPALRHAYARSLRSRRWRALGLVIGSAAVVWMVGGVALFNAASVLRSIAGGSDLALQLGLAVAVIWQLSPLKQHCLNRHCTHPPLASFGAAADRDAFRFGASHAAWCLGSCWALMLVSLLAPAWHLGVMLVVSWWMWVEPFDRPERPTWRVRLPVRFFRITQVTARSLLRGLAVRAGATG